MQKELTFKYGGRGENQNNLVSCKPTEDSDSGRKIDRMLI